ncbi:hypothetical protein KGY77_11550 [Candidatus Bipolaricaulota bacterium]|nr:hypothetical protein [Candidatus Bipolaricaulota bacterium]
MKNLKYCVLIALVSLLAINSLASAQEAEMETYTSDRSGITITLIYPSYSDPSVIQSFMNKREKELVAAETILNLKVSSSVEIKIDPVLISGGAGFRNSNVFHYTVPYCILSGNYKTTQFFYQDCSGAKETGVHEITHLLAKRKLNPLVPPFLAEGLAEAMDFTHRPKDVVDPHLASIGLLLLDEFRPLSELFVLTRRGLTWSDQKKYFYWQGGSFVAFLIEEYGPEKFKDFYRTDYITLTLRPEEAVEEIYGKSISKLETDWKNFLEGYATGEESRAKFFLETWEDRLGQRLYEQLVKIWEEHPFELIGYSSKAYGLTRERHCARVDLGNLSGPSVDQALKSYQEANQEVKELLATWLRAAELYKSSREDIGRSKVKTEEATSQLRKARDLYLKAGDNYMADEVSKMLN